MERIPRGRMAWSACKLLLGVSLLALVLWRNWDPPGGLGLARVVCRPLQLTPLLLALAFGVLALLWGIVRWHRLVRAQGLEFRLRDALRLGCLSYFWSTVLPGAVGGDVVKALLLAREHSRRAAAVASVLVDRVVGLTGLFVLAGGAGGAYWLVNGEALRRLPALFALVAVSLALSGGALLAGLLAGLLPERVGSAVGAGLRRLPLAGPMTAALWDALWLYRSRRASVAVALLLAVVGQVCILLNFYFAAQVFGEPAADLPSLAEHFLIVPAGLLFQSVFPSPGGVGGGEYGFGQLYALVGSPEAQGVLASLAVRAITWGLCLVGGAAYLVGRRRGKQAAAPAQVLAFDRAGAGPAEGAARRAA
jgi:uncharacterized membrane protein YbhN (UPF0104 family)